MMMVRPALEETPTSPKRLCPLPYTAARNPLLDIHSLGHGLMLSDIFETQLLLGGVAPPRFSALTEWCEVIYQTPFFWRCSLKVMFKGGLSLEDGAKERGNLCA